VQGAVELYPQRLKEKLKEHLKRKRGLRQSV
jgi:hypothetical protein